MLNVIKGGELMDWFENIKSIFELLYFIASIALVIGLYFGYEQLKVMRKDILDNHKRNAVEKSIEYLDWFASSFIPESSNYYAALNGKKLPSFGENELTFNHDFSSDNKINESVIIKNDNGVIDLCNKLEFFSAAINSGLADETLLITPLAKSYCEFIENNYDVYCSIRSRKNSKKLYENTRILYTNWSKQLIKFGLEEEKEEIKKREDALNIQPSRSYIGQ